MYGYIAGDGRNKHILKNDDTLLIKKSPYDVSCIKLYYNNNYYYIFIIYFISNIRNTIKYI